MHQKTDADRIAALERKLDVVERALMHLIEEVGDMRASAAHAQEVHNAVRECRLVERTFGRLDG